jgi:uncharacterized protein (UPF0548 family)
MLGRMDGPLLLAGDRLAELALAPLTYPEVGASLRKGPLPAGYGHLRRRAVVGHGPDALDRATEALLGWAVQRGAGVRVVASSPLVLPAVVADLRLGPGPLSLRAPVRVVDVVEGPRRRGFAYGTLPGHPEAGEESFVVSLGEDGAVTFTVRAFSRPDGAVARLSGPVGRRAQRLVAGRYLRSLGSLVRTS